MICFYVELEKNRDLIECASFDLGNPGIGGTQYLFIITVISLNKLYGYNFATLLTDIKKERNYKEPLNIQGNIRTPEEAVKYCEEHHIETIVFNANVLNSSKANLFNTRVNIVLWAHNTLPYTLQRIAAKTESIKKVVCVSESQYRNMSDSVCFDKCTFINNIIPESFVENAKTTDYSENKVAYVGCLMPQKGIHNLLDIWKYVEESSPETKLYVFGSAKMWHTSNGLDNNCFADQFYARIIKKKLKALKHPENIVFMGAKGWSFINEFISTFRLGIVNPSHYMRDETFCLSAIEFSAHGLPVVSRDRKDGLTTTVIHNETGFLEKDDKQIAQRIIAIVNNPSLASSLGTAGRKHSRNFFPEKNVIRWNCIETEIRENKSFSTTNHNSLISKDSFLLFHDHFLTVIYTILSRKIFFLAMKKMKRLFSI